MNPLTLVAAVALTCLPLTPPAGAAERLALAADRSEIAELGAQFDNSLDAERPEPFVATFVPEGVLAGFWGESKGPAAIRGAFDFMLATFARGKRHLVTNHQITVDGDRATMFSYLTVMDRKSLSMTGTATFTDELVRRDGHWRFLRRTLAADPNVDPIIAGLRK